MRLRWRWLWWLGGLVGVGLALKSIVHFPWRVTFAALLAADAGLLAVALVVNLSSLAAKGWAWHLILKRAAPHSWRAAQEANLVGSAVNDLSVAVAGEVARVQWIARRAGVPVAAAISSVVWTRVAEALALALFLVMAPSVLQLEPWLRAVQVGVGRALGEAVAAGLAVQGLQVLPVLLLGAVVTGWRLLGLTREFEQTAGAA